MIFVIALLGVGGAVTDVGPWYRALKKPVFTPPGWAFAPAWTVILASAATAGVLAWRTPGPGPWRLELLAAFGLNGVLHFLWSPMFFRLRRPDLALVEMAFLWTSILVLMAVTARAGLIGPLLLIPYFVWVSFAAVVNAEVVRLNGPFKIAAAER